MVKVKEKKDKGELRNQKSLFGKENRQQKIFVKLLSETC
jgi:hypothetical protein